MFYIVCQMKARGQDVLGPVTIFHASPVEEVRKIRRSHKKTFFWIFLSCLSKLRFT